MRLRSAGTPKLRNRLVEWRHALPVRFAHHPLCARHQKETWCVGGVYLCKGCVSLAAGLLLATTAVLLIPGAWVFTAAACLLPTVLAVSWPRWYSKLPRRIRDISRFALGTLIAFGSFSVFSFPILWPALVLSFMAWSFYKGQRRQVLAHRCDGCPELGRGVCSGYARQIQAMRAIEAALEAELEARYALFGAGKLPLE